MNCAARGKASSTALPLCSSCGSQVANAEHITVISSEGDKAQISTEGFASERSHHVLVSSPKRSGEADEPFLGAPASSRGVPDTHKLLP